MKALAWLISLSTLCTAACSGPQPRSEVVRRLLSTSERDAVLDTLIRWNGGAVGGVTPGSRVNHVVVCPQPEGDSLYAVFVSGEYDAMLGAGPGRPLGGVALFDSSGVYVPYYHRANFIQGQFRDLNADGIIENVQSVETISKSVHVTCLYVVSILRDPLPLLCVATNPSSRTTNRWSWRATDSDSDGLFEIEIGPVLGPPTEKASSPEVLQGHEVIEPRVIYRWSTEEGAYVGPAGGDQELFRLVSPEHPLAGLHTFDRWGEE